MADSSANTIRRVTPTGATETFAGMANARGAADGTRTSARFSSPHGITLDAGNNIYVGDYANCTIRRITPLAVVTTPVGTPPPGACRFTPASAPPSLSPPRWLAVVGSSLYFTAGNGVGKVAPLP